VAHIWLFTDERGPVGSSRQRFTDRYFRCPGSKQGRCGVGSL